MPKNKPVDGLQLQTQKEFLWRSLCCMIEFQITEETLQSSAHKQLWFNPPHDTKATFDSDPGSAATLSSWSWQGLTLDGSSLGQGQCLGCSPGLLPPTLPGPGAAEGQAGPQPFCHLCWKQFEGPELAEHFSDTAWHQLGIAERWHFRQGRG